MCVSKFKYFAKQIIFSNCPGVRLNFLSWGEGVSVVTPQDLPHKQFLPLPIPSLLSSLRSGCLLIPPTHSPNTPLQAFLIVTSPIKVLIAHLAHKLPNVFSDCLLSKSLVLIKILKNGPKRIHFEKIACKIVKSNYVRYV